MCSKVIVDRVLTSSCVTVNRVCIGTHLTHPIDSVFIPNPYTSGPDPPDQGELAQNKTDPAGLPPKPAATPTTTADDLPSPPKKPKKKWRLTCPLLRGELGDTPNKRCPISLKDSPYDHSFRIHHSILAQIDGWCAVLFHLRINWDLCGSPLTACSTLFGLKDHPWAAFFPVINAPLNLIPAFVARACLEKACAVFIVPVWPKNGPPMDNLGTTWYQLLQQRSLATFSIRLTPHTFAAPKNLPKPAKCSGFQAVVANFGPLHYTNRRPHIKNIEIFPITSIRISAKILPVPLVIPHLRDFVADPARIPETLPKDHAPLTECDLIPAQPTAPSPLRADRFAELTADYPYPEFRAFGLQGLQSGFGHFLGDPNYHRTIPNSRSLKGHEDQARSNILKEIAAGRMLGPFARPPFPSQWCPSQPRLLSAATTPKHKFVESPDVRLLGDMSAGRESAYNFLFHNHMLAMYYLKLGDLIALIRFFGPNCVVVCLDVQSAYRLLKLSSADFCRFVTCLPNKDGVDEFFVDLCNPFGSTQSQIHWECVAALMWWAIKKAGIDYMWNYVDNFFAVIPPLPSGSTDCVKAFEVQGVMHKTLTSLGVPYHEDMVGTVLKGLGWISNCVTLRIRCPPLRMVVMRRVLAEWSLKASCTVQELMSIVGLLLFISLVHQQGRPALRLLFDLRAKGLHACKKTKVSRKILKLKIPARVSAALSFWKDNLPSWDAEGAMFPSVFFNESYVVELRLDASTSWGAGGVDLTKHRFFASPWQPAERIAFTGTGSASAPVGEGWAFKLAARLWFADYKHAQIRILTDSATFSQALQAGHSDSDEMLGALLEVKIAALKYDISLHIAPIPRTQNEVSDALSYGRIPAARAFLAVSHPSAVFSETPTSNRASLIWQP
jgi:hypothetical protein